MASYRAHRGWRILALALAITAAGCGQELLGGAQDGEVRTVATSDESAEGSRAAMGPAAARSMSTAVESAAALEGELSFTAAAWLIPEEGDPVPLTDGFVRGTFRIEGAGDSSLGRVDVLARTYTAVRVAFTSVSAVIEGGLVIGGAPLIGNVSVQLPAGGLTVERPLHVVVQPHTSTTLVLDLNAHVWLPATTLPGRTVPAEIFRSAVGVRIR